MVQPFRPWPPDRATAIAYGATALLGQIGTTIVGVAMEFESHQVTIRGFYQGAFSADDREALDDAVGYVVAEAPAGTKGQLHFIRATERVLSARGVWVFLRAGFIGVGPSDPRYVPEVTA